MHWDDEYFHGTREPWSWAVARGPILGLGQQLLRCHANALLCITSFDGGSILPTDEELALGWSRVEDVMVSPHLGDVTAIPRDNHDEWYIFDALPDSFAGLERFVNCGNFSLVDPERMQATFDPTWERGHLDWLYPIQARFWAQLNRLAPVTFVGRGDFDVVVTRDPTLAAWMLRLTRRTR